MNASFTPSRRSLLRTALVGTAAVTAGTALAPGLTDSALAAPSRPKLPASWSNTVFTSRLQNELQGVIAAFGPSGFGKARYLTPRQLKQTEIIGAFVDPYDPSGRQTWTPSINGGVRLDAASREVVFRGSKGGRYVGHLQLVRTPNPAQNALLLRIDGTRAPQRRLPQGVRIGYAIARIDTISQMTSKLAATTLRDAVHYTFSEEGPQLFSVSEVAVHDGGQRISGRVHGTVRGTRVDAVFYGVAQNALGGVGYLVGQLPR